ncbi:MAG: hypothetical protein R3E63_09195 [Pseudomonadales bacterium]
MDELLINPQAFLDILRYGHNRVLQALMVAGDDYQKISERKRYKK